jgi:outer membrane protein OmpU
MNKLKKVGLTALATTLVASSAFAGEMTASGSASLNYSGISTASGNPYSMGNSVTLSGGGELDNGMTVSVSFELDNGYSPFDDHSLSLGLGDGMGTLGFSGGSTSPGGVDSVKDIIPTAYTPVYENTDSTDNGLATISGRSQASMWGYQNSVGDLAVSIGFNPTNSTAHTDGSETGVGLTYTPSQVEGLTIVAGNYDDERVADANTYGIKYTMGATTVAAQRTDINYDGATADQESTAYGISFALNENFSISAGALDVDIAGASADEENRGISASYTMGSITIAGNMNSVDNIGGASGTNAEVTGVNIAFAF